MAILEMNDKRKTPGILINQNPNLVLNEYAVCDVPRLVDAKQTLPDIGVGLETTGVAAD